MLKNIKIANRHGDPLTTDLRYYENVEEKMPLIIFCHGFKGFKDWGGFPFLMHELSFNNIFSVSFNFSYNGTDNTQISPVEFTRLDLFAQNTFSRELDDLGSVIDYLQEHQSEYNYDFDNLTLIGHSRGGGIAILKTAEDNRVRRLITLATVSEFDRYSSERKLRWKEDGFLEVLNTRTMQKMRMNYSLLEDLEKNYDRLNISGAVSKINVPSLFIHGDQDLAVDCSDSEKLYNLSNESLSNLRIYTNTGHTFGVVHPFTGTTKALENLIKEIVAFVY
jgi:acetyl esterase/lipase